MRSLQMLLGISIWSRILMVISYIGNQNRTASEPFIHAMLAVYVPINEAPIRTTCLCLSRLDRLLSIDTVGYVPLKIQLFQCA